MAVGYTFVMEKTCPVCGNQPVLLKYGHAFWLRMSIVILCIIKDFSRIIIRSGVCEHCGFATDEKQLFVTHAGEAPGDLCRNSCSREIAKVWFLEVRGHAGGR